MPNNALQPDEKRAKVSKFTNHNSQFSIIIIFVALAMLGCALIPRLPVKLMPSRTLPSLTVTFSMPDAAARVVESEVTSKLESMLARIQGVKEITSKSSNGNGRITIGFDKHTDMQQARFEASTIVRQAWPQLPAGVSYPYVTAARTISQASSPVLSYTVNAPGSASEIMQYAEEKIRPAIGRLQGVNRVDLSGATPMEWQLTYDNTQLKTLGLTPANLLSAISEQTSSQFLGMAISGAGEWLSVRSIVEDNKEFDATKIFVSLPDSTLIRLDKVVRAKYVESQPTGYFRINGLTSVYCNIYADEDANQLEVADRVKTTLAALRLPAGYELNLSSDSTEYISKELDKIYFRTGLTLVILLLFVALITLNLRYMAVITLSLMLSLGVSVIFYYLLGVEIQLYSLAGITISLNLIIDNIIVMSDHYRRKGNLRAFTSVLAATLTTVGALGIVFFLDDELKLNLQDFVSVVIINLCVSLFASLWLVPALIERIGLGMSARQVVRRRRLRLLSRFNRGYAAFIVFSRRWRWVYVVIAIFAFGLPVFMLPKQVEGCELYNKTLGSKTYNEIVRPWVDKIFGGTLRLFVEDVFEGSYFSRDQAEPTLYIAASLPNGSTLTQMDELIRQMESFLLTYGEIKQLRASIYSANNANLSITFQPWAVKSGFPYRLKSEAISKALALGSGEWGIYGLDDMGFNNSLHEQAGSYRVKLSGYNYDELEGLAERFKERLQTHKRVRDVTIASEFSWYKNDYREFSLDIDTKAMARLGINVSDLYSVLTDEFGHGADYGVTFNGTARVMLRSAAARTHDVWALMNLPMACRDRQVKLCDFAKVSVGNAPASVVKENQQYVLCLQYEYVGAPQQGERVLKKDIEEFSADLPIGYFIESQSYKYSWNRSSATNYWLLALVVMIIFFTTAILFNSLRQPLIILFTIPISFIGVFLVFYLTKMNFDQGGFASFVLLSGITVNAAIYLLNEYNRTRNYLRAFNAKIIPILLTVLSTILGFLPFIIGNDSREAFWFPLALGTIGGLAMSLVAIIIYIPLFISPAKDKSRIR